MLTSALAFLTDLLLLLGLMALAMQGYRIMIALKTGKIYRLRWLLLSMAAVILVCPGVLLMPASPAVVFLSVAGALKTALCFGLLLSGHRLSSLTYEAMMVLPKSDRG